MKTKIELITTLLVSLSISVFPAETTINVDTLASKYNMAKDLFEGTDSIYRNRERALELFIELANENYSDAQYVLGDLYHRGVAVKENDSIAMVWYRKAIDNNNANAMKDYGLILYEKKDTIGAMNLLKRSITINKDAYAMNAYGVMCINANNIEEGLHWYYEAAIRKHVQAQKNLCSYYTQIEEWDTALYWAFKALEQQENDGELNTVIGYIYHRINNFSECVKWSERGCEYGDSQACINLGLLYSAFDSKRKDFASIVPPNFELAQSYFTKAMNMGNIRGQYYLGALLYSGIEGDNNYKKSKGYKANCKRGIELMKDAANKGFEDAKSFIRDNNIK